MLRVDRSWVTLGATLAVAAVAGVTLWAQAAPPPPTNDLPNPYQTVEGFFKMPEGRTWGSTSAVDVSPDSKIIWVAERCGANTCWDATAGKTSASDVVLKFDQASGKLLGSFGAGMFIFPHGIHVDRQGNVWVTDGQDNLPRRRPGQPADAPLPPPPAKVIGHQVYKFSPEGKLLLTLGKPGGNQPGQPPDPGSFYQPNDVITYPNGDILVAEGHGGTHARLSKFDSSGKFLMEFGKRGPGLEGEFDQPHGLAFDSKGRLFVADRSNNRVQVFDRNMQFVDEWRHFGRPSGIAILRDDTLIVADSESSQFIGGPPQAPEGGGNIVRNPGWGNGIRIGSAKDGSLRYYVQGTRPEGMGADNEGNVFAGLTGGCDASPSGGCLQKWVKK
jgi:DNA-binding beta-propeller fold protein YncE